MSSEWESLPAEQLLAVVRLQADQLRVQGEQITSLTAQIEVLTAQVAELNRRLGRNSQNSSLPPSSDRGNTPPRKPRRGGTGRKPGGQPGRDGRTREMTADPDEVLDHVPTQCAGCGGDLTDAAVAGEATRRQVTDIPEPVAPVTIEHRLHARTCACGRTTRAAAPAGVNAPVQLGPNVAAVAVYLVVFQHVAVERAAMVIADLCGIDVSTGWISSQVAATAAALSQATAAIVDHLHSSPVIGVDETSVSVGGVRYWLHVARTDTLTAYFLHPNRGRVAVDAFGVLPDYDGVIVRDALAVYDGPAYAQARHALCSAHLLRELAAAAEDNPGQVWPAQARDALLALNRLAVAARDAADQVDADKVAEHVQWFDRAIAVGLAQNPAASGRKQSPSRNLLLRMQKRRTDYLRFIGDLAVPFTNNGSERDLRPVKTQQKISGSHRTPTGASNWATIRSYISTLRKQHQDVLTRLRDARSGNTWIPTLI